MWQIVERKKVGKKCQKFQYLFRKKFATIAIKNVEGFFLFGVRFLLLNLNRCHRNYSLILCMPISSFSQM